MKILLIGSTGHIGSAVLQRLLPRHEVAASRSTGHQVDVTDPSSLAHLFDQVGPIDAVVATVGAVPFKPLAELTRADYLAGLSNKTLAQIDVALQAIPYLNDGGSITLTTGVVGRELIRTGAAAAAANGALEYFVPAAAAELPRSLRLNAISPTVLTEAVGYHSSFPGFLPVPAAVVAEAYVRSVEGIETGRTYLVP